MYELERMGMIASLNPESVAALTVGIRVGRVVLQAVQGRREVVGL